MSDKELLELAAKAAGLNRPIWLDYERAISYLGGGLTGPKSVLWNPLADDGDALRLVVKLRLLVDVPLETSEQVITVVVPRYLDVREPVDKDHFAATRRAIVRAAAEIGRAMR